MSGDENASPRKTAASPAQSEGDYAPYEDMGSRYHLFVAKAIFLVTAASFSTARADLARPGHSLGEAGNLGRRLSEASERLQDLAKEVEARSRFLGEDEKDVQAFLDDNFFNLHVHRPGRDPSTTSTSGTGCFNPPGQSPVEAMWPDFLPQEDWRWSHLEGRLDSRDWASDLLYAVG
ncbi:hypothetical protein FHS85_003548 [Rhodoligotrophos appendicifer]|uniref:hypothetical protein n=1 Tax=Rhodoligotrophos appendicifer TaxID=987056 RepID=UPI0011866398|nr:hypothetical protein [Rhodoligotrophos appendicifer]